MTGVRDFRPSPGEIPPTKPTISAPKAIKEHSVKDVKLPC